MQRTDRRKTVLVTGTSSGIGRATAEHFSARGWNVAATMRRPEADTALRALANTKLYALDVTSNDSIESAMESVVRDFGAIDCLVNNAGYGVDGVFEAMSDEVIAKQFETNVFGLMKTTRAVIPRMRANGGGSIVQIASMGGRITFPLFSLYHGTKWAVEGFSESLHYELRPFGIHVKIVEPGAIKTDFYGRSRVFVGGEREEYRSIVAKAEKVSQGPAQTGAPPELVARAIEKAATHTGRRIRFAVGAPAPMLLALRRFLPETLFFAIVRSSYGL
ncbi:MAG: SDR family oxidoreductase [Myxococcales bacterium]|nr:SDR family oxidoreductase [Myxococcales bacterium]